MRVAVGCISHETSTFTPVPTTWESFEERFGFLRGQAILETFGGTNTPVGGFMEGAQAHGFDLVPTVFGQPQPSGPMARVLFDEVVGELVEALQRAGELDGVLLEIHGSMVAEGVDDADGHILTAVRQAVGPDVPVLAQLDIHANVSQTMVRAADVLIGRETYPEVDMAPRGRECADVLARMHSEGLRPAMALHQIPMIWGMNQVTGHQPMSAAIAELHRIERVPGVVCASIATGYSLADAPDMGSSVYVVTDGDADLAQRCADQLGAWIYERRAEWHFHRPSTAAAIAAARQEGRYPVIIADRDDNTGGGSPGDSTGMLRAFLEAGLEDACVLYVVDEEAASACHRAGAGAEIDLAVGGKSSPLQGEPCAMRARVEAVSDGRFRYDGPMYAGLEASMGTSAHIRQGGVHVLLVSRREQPFDTAFARTLGLEPRTMQWVGVKSAAHFRAGFESWAGAVHLVSEPSVHSDTALVYQRLGRQVYPVSQA